MKKYKLHPKGFHWLVNEDEAYTYSKLDPVKLVETVKTLDGMKNVYFMPSTDFPRADFKKYYPDINIRRVIKDIDCVIFDDKTESPKSIKVNGVHKYSPHIFADDINNVLYTQNLVMGNSFYRSDSIRFNQPDKTSIFDGHLAGVKEVDKYLKIINDGIPCIHINSVFTDFTTQVRESSLTLDEAMKYYRQVQSKDMAIVQSALDIVASLDPNVYLPFQSLILSAFKTNSQVLIRDITSKKFKTFNKFMSDKCFNFERNNYSSNNKLIWYGQQFINTTPYGNINNFISTVEKSTFFTEDMEYDTALICLLNELRIDLSYDCLDISDMLNGIKSNKIKSELINVIGEEVKPEPEQSTEYDWGV